MQRFRKGTGHMAIVVDVVHPPEGKDPYYEFKGIITLEDIVEVILGAEITDELDDFTNDNGKSDIRQRDRELAMKVLLSDTTMTDKLNPLERSAVASHLMNNIPSFQKIANDLSGGTINNISSLDHMLSKLKTVTLSRTSDEAMIQNQTALEEDVIFRRGTPSNECMLILNGKILVYAGNDNFRSELGSWSILGLDALRSNTDSFVPDFSAYVLSETLHYVVLKKKDFKFIVPSAERRRKGNVSILLNCKLWFEITSIG